MEDSGDATRDDPRDDRQLLAAHVAGDAEAFGTLFARHRDRLWAVALRTSGDPDLAADALQDGLIAAFRRAASYRGEAAVTTWLHRIVVNATLDLHRRRAVRATEPLDDAYDGPPVRASSDLRAAAGAVPHAESDADPLRHVLARERRSAVAAALRELPPDQRAALVLVDVEGWSVAEAAEVLDCASGTVKSRCSRGRRRLAALLRELDESAGTEAVSVASHPRDRPERRAAPPAAGSRRPREPREPREEEGSP